MAFAHDYGTCIWNHWASEATVTCLPASYHPVSSCGKEAVSIAVVIETSTYLHSVSLRSPHLLTEKKSSLDRFLFEH